MRLLWEYTSTDCTVGDSVCNRSFLRKWSMYTCMLQFSILIKRHNTDYECACVCFAACLPATVLHDSLRAGTNFTDNLEYKNILDHIMWSSMLTQNLYAYILDHIMWSSMLTQNLFLYSRLSVNIQFITCCKLELTAHSSLDW